MDITTSLDSIGKRIRYLRTSLGLNQNEFSLKYGSKSKMSASRWESDRSLPNINTLINIANDGKVTLDWLLKGGPITIISDGFMVSEDQVTYTANEFEDMKERLTHLKEENNKLKSQIEILKELIMDTNKGDK